MYVHVLYMYLKFGKTKRESQERDVAAAGGVGWVEARSTSGIPSMCVVPFPHIASFSFSAWVNMVNTRLSFFLCSSPEPHSQRGHINPTQHVDHACLPVTFTIRCVKRPLM